MAFGTIPYGLIVARQRSGTGALGSLFDLGKHPKLKYMSEVFNPDDVGGQHCYFTKVLDYVSEDRDNALPIRNVRNFRQFLDEISVDGKIPILDVKYNSLHSLDGGWQSPLGPPPDSIAGICSAYSNYPFNSSKLSFGIRFRGSGGRE